MFRISGLYDSQIWNIGLEKVAHLRNLPLLGRFDVNAGFVCDQGLRFNPDVDTTSRHADIVGWPEEKEKRQSIAQHLAAEAKVFSSPGNL